LRLHVSKPSRYHAVTIIHPAFQPPLLREDEIAELSGLTRATAAHRLRDEGSNELPSTRPRSVLRIAADILREPMLLLLVGGGVLYLLLGDVREALFLLFFVLVVMGITFYQERKTERVLEALRDLSSPRALVIRDGQEIRIAGREVVREDIIVLSEGDRVPADARVLWCSNLATDESLLTGESATVRKRTGEAGGERPRPGGDDLPFVFAGTLVVSGKAVTTVEATGPHTEIGRIGRTLHALAPEDTPMQIETRRLVRVFALVGLSLCVVAVAAYGARYGDWLRGLLAGIAFAMAVLPEEFPVILTVFLALGAWRISRAHVLTRRMPAIEALGAATVLCVDKTGTITQNRMSVARLWASNDYLDVSTPRETLPESFHELIEFAILASQRDPFDPMEKALRSLGESTLARTEHLHADWELVREYPLSPELLALSHVWRAPDRARYVVAAKGAPEAIVDLCHLDASQQRTIADSVQALAARGLRVLGVAQASFREPQLPRHQHDFEFRFVGLAGLVDPIRDTVPQAVDACRDAGIRVVMITGDYAGTARHVAEKIGLAAAADVLNGAELERLDDTALRQRVRQTNIYARVAPEQKLRLVNALKANDEIVAMTGDGVNDAPALRSAHIGIAMGARGTDVAREAADLVLLDDDFASIVAAVQHGRRVADNLHKAFSYILAVHVPIAGLSLLPILFGWPLILTPVHIAFLQLIIDPTSSIVLEAEQLDPNAMRRPPRPRGEPLFTRRAFLVSALQGGGVLLVMLAVTALTLYRDLGEFEARALTFTALVVANLALVLTNRSWSRSAVAMLRVPNPALWWVVGGTVIGMAAVLYVPALQALFRFSQLHIADIVFCIAAGLIGVAWFEWFKHRLAPTRRVIPH
jgi:Ca2+-transporting ATPase